MNNKNARIVILCEDLQQQVFVRHFLIKRGFNPRRIRTNRVPDGRGSGEQYVRNEYPEQVRAYRRKPKTEDFSLIVVIDADTKTVQNRFNELDEMLDRNSLKKRQSDEKIAIFIPKCNIETWIHYLQGEIVDEDTIYEKLSEESECKPCREELTNQCSSGLDETAPPSLQIACQEWQRILSSS